MKYGSLLCAVTVLGAITAGVSNCSRSAAPGATGDSGVDLPGSDFGQVSQLVSLTVEPKDAQLDSDGTPGASLAFDAIGTFADGHTGSVRNFVRFSLDAPAVGNVDAAGTFRASGQRGGVVRVTASAGTLQASATLTVKLRVHASAPADAPAGAEATLGGATEADATAKLAYPYDQTVFPRGLAAPTLMVTGGAADDLYLVTIDTNVFEYRALVRPSAVGELAFEAATWTKFVESVAGTANLRLARLAGGRATVVSQQTWRVAPANLQGSVYYWAQNQGRVLRLKPGHPPEDFTQSVLPTHACTMTCHTVSADGSTLVSGGDVLAGVLDLRTNKPGYSLVPVAAPPPNEDAASNAVRRTWSNAALSPDGRYLVQNGRDLPGPPGKQSGLYRTQDGTKVAASGFDDRLFGDPAFAPDGKAMVFVDPASGDLYAMDFDAAVPRGSNVHRLVERGTGAPIHFPTVSPDGRWVAYERATLNDTRGTCTVTNGVETCDYATRSGLFLIGTAAGSKERRLGRANGDGYPFAAGDRDRDLNWEPTFAPVPAGGYFWLVFTSRRTYGTRLAGALSTTKQLWVAAIDQVSVVGEDPSHAPFLLPGQEPTLNMRGFWALDPCKADGAGCEAGSECCGGYCAPGDAGTAGVCKSVGACAREGDRCKSSDDCCTTGRGVSCVGGVCSPASPN
jgi:hypothetical protein